MSEDHAGVTITAQPAGLDVERLARALHGFSCNGYLPDEDCMEVVHRIDAKKIAREYAAAQPAPDALPHTGHTPGQWACTEACFAAGVTVAQPDEPTIGPIQHANSMCQKDGCTCWCQACERHNWRHERAPQPAGLDVERAAFPWHRETIGHASVDQIAESVAASLHRNDNTDATWLVDSEDRIVAFVGNGPRQTDNGDLILAAIAREYGATQPAPDALRAAAQAMLAHHDDLVSVPSCDPLNCNEAAALRAALEQQS